VIVQIDQLYDVRFGDYAIQQPVGFCDMITVAVPEPAVLSLSQCRRILGGDQLLDGGFVSIDYCLVGTEPL